MTSLTKCVLPLLSVLALSATAWAGPIGHNTSPEEKQQRELERQVKTYRLLKTMQLSEAQKKVVVPLIRQELTERAAMEDAQRTVEPAFAPAIGKLHAEVLRGQGVSEDVKKGVREAEKPYKDVKKQNEIEGPSRLANMWAALTTNQGAALRRGEAWMVDPARMPEPLRHAGDKLARALSESPNEIDGVLATLYEKFGLQGAEIPPAVVHGRAVLAQLSKTRPIPDAAWSRVIDLPATGILGPLDEETAKKMDRLLLSPLALQILDGKTVPVTEYEAPAALDSQVADIKVMNLVNALYLDKKQMKDALGLLAEAERDFGPLEARQKAFAARSLPVLHEALAAFSAGQWPPPATEQQLRELGRERKSIKDDRERLEARYVQRLHRLLSANQIDIASNFVPCTVPIQSLTNPERVGQANDNSAIEKALERLRKLPSERLALATAKLQDKVEHEMREHKHPELAAAARAKVPEIVAQARAMDGAQFQVQKGELAKEIAVPPKPKAVGDKLDQRLVDYLLSPQLRPILAARVSAR